MTGVRDDLLASLVEAVARLNQRVTSPLTPAEAQGIIEAWLVLHLAELRGLPGEGLPPTQAQIADAVAAWFALNSESLRGPPPAMTDITEAVRLWMALNEHRMRGAPGRDPTAAEIASAAAAWLERNRESLKGENGRGIERMAISKFGDLIVYYTDGTSQNLGKVRGDESRTTIISRGGGGGAGGGDAVDNYTGGEILAQQTGAAGVLTFTFSEPQNIAWVQFFTGTSTDICYADPLGGTPAIGVGIQVYEAIPMPLHFDTSEVKVYAVTGAKVVVWGGKR